MNFLKFIAASLLLCCTTHSASAATDVEIGAAVARSIDQTIRPGFEVYAASSASLQKQMDALCEAPSDQALLDTRDSFAKAVVSWGQVEFFRLGPLTENNRLERVLFWPDRRGLGLRQVQKQIAKPDDTALSADEIGGKSVAVQGLLALEFVLFGTGSDSLVGADAKLRCMYGYAIAGNLAKIGKELLAGWQTDSAIVKSWTTPGSQNPLFRDSAEQIAMLIRLLREGTEIIKVQRADPILGETREKTKPKRAVFWRSGLTTSFLAANFKGLLNLTEAVELLALLDEDNRRFGNSLVFEFRNAIRTLDGFQADLSTLPNNEEAYNQLSYTRIVTDSILQLLEGPLPAAFGLSSGFSSLDGD